MNLLLFRNWHGRQDREKEERRDNAKAEACHRKLNEGLEKARQEPDRENRVRILCRLPSDLHYVSRSLHDRYIDETTLQVALRAEFLKLREVDRRSNPLSAAILAAKLKIWFPEIRKQGK